MLIVTGGIACGKSTFVEAARELGYKIIDADEWYHDVYKLSTSFDNAKQLLFGSVSIGAVAFRHSNWKAFERIVAAAFCTYATNNQPRIVVIPEYFKHKRLIDRHLGPVTVLTIERKDNYSAAYERDSEKRSADLTARIINAQTPSTARVVQADHVMYNGGSRDEFKQECQAWLKLHLPEVSIPRTRGIAMWWNRLNFWDWT